MLVAEREKEGSPLPVWSPEVHAASPRDSAIARYLAEPHARTDATLLPPACHAKADALLALVPLLYPSFVWNVASQAHGTRSRAWSILETEPRFVRWR